MGRLVAALLLLGSVARAETGDAFLERWLAAQNGGDFAAYSALYASGFQGVRRSGQKTVQLDREGWLRDRERMFKKKMIVGASELRVDGLELSFRQSFESGSYRDVGQKKMTLVREDGELKIAREELLASEKPPRVLVADPGDRMKDGDSPPRVTLWAGHLDTSQPPKVSLELRVAFREAMPTDWQKCQYIRQREDGGEEPLAAERTVAGPDGWAVRVRFESPAPIERFTLRCPEGASAPTVAFGLSAPSNAFLVAVELGGDPALAQAAFKKLDLPTHNGWPHLYGAEWILGLRGEGFLAAVAAADDESVANALARALKKSGVAGVAVRRVWWPEPEPLRLVTVERIDDRNGIYSSLEWAGGFILQSGSYETGVRARTHLANEMLVMPYTLGKSLKESFQLVFEGAQADCKAMSLSSVELMQKPILTLRNVKTRCVQGD